MALAESQHIPHEVRRRQGPGRRGTRRSTRRSSGSTPLPRARHTAFCARSGAPSLTASLGQAAGACSAVCSGTDWRQRALLAVSRCVAVHKLSDVAVPEQVIEVPKIFVDAIPSRRLCRDPQMAETVGGSADAVPCSRSFAAYGRPAGESAADRASACPVFCGCGWVHLKQIAGPTGVEGGLLSHPVGLPTGVHRQARAV